MDHIGSVFRIMFFSTIGTIIILVPITVLLAGLGFLVTKYFKNKED